MFKLKYNLLALIQVLIGLVNYFLLIKVFGVSNSADAYLVTSAILASIVLIQMLSTEQFLFFYNDIKENSKSDAYDFYNASLMVALITGLISFVLCYFGSLFVLDIFVANFDNERLLLMQLLFKIASIELLFAPILLLNQKLLNAEMKFSIPYIFNIIPSLFVLFAMLYLFHYEIEDISLLVYARVFGISIIMCLSLIVIKSYDIPVKLKLKHDKLKIFLKNSVSMRFGHNIHNFLFTPITTNILSMLPTGYASYFYYAYRMVLIIHGIVVGPTYNVFQSKFSNEWSKRNYLKAKKLMRQYLIITFPILSVFGIMGYFILPYILQFISSEFTYENLEIIKNLFIGLMIWQLIIILESGSVALLMINKNSSIFIFVNTLFVFSYFFISQLLFDRLSIYSILIGLIIGQLLNYFLYVYYAKKILKEKEMGNDKSFCTNTNI